MSDNKISIDVTINAEGKQQLDQYKTAFDGLRTSINNLSNPISKLDSEVGKLNENLNKTGKENNVVGDTIEKIVKSSNTAKDAIKLFKEAVGLLKVEVSALEATLTMGLSVIIAFGPQLIEIAKGFFKGGEAADKAKLSFSAMSGALQSGAVTDAAKQLSELKINVDLAKGGLLSKKEVLQQYNTTVGKTMGQVSTLKEVEEKLVKGGPAYIRMTMLKAAAQQALEQSAKKANEAAELKLKSDEESANFGDKVVAGLKSMVSGPFGWINYNRYVRQAGAERRQESMQSANQAKEDYLKIAEDYQKEAAQLAKNNGADLFGGEFSSTNAPKKKAKKPEKPILPDKTKVLEAMSLNFAETLELEKKHYEEEKAVLDTLLNEKIISQQNYQLQSEALQEKYHQNIGTRIKKFNEVDFNTAKKHFEEIAKVNNQAALMKQDEKDIKKALLPGDKLNAQKKQIEDKYNYEITLAAGNATKIKDLETQKQQALTEISKKHEQERQDFIFGSTQKAADAAFSLLQGSIKSQSSDRLKELAAEKEAELSNTSLTATQKKAIEDKYKKKENEEKVKAFKAEQKASILQAVINGALAVTKAMSQVGILGAFVIPGIIASTAIQIATIAAQKPPKYAKGGLHYQSDGRGTVLSGYSTTDNTNAYLRSGEAVVVSEAMRNPWARNLVSAINVAYGGRDFSVTNPGHGYAIGGIFTDGGNSNRYYNQPMNDQKDLANTIAYQMINNFPPVYVDVKDINTQQNIMAQTINRVNL
ncbi:MAG: hypothetical protein EOP47_04595 [Sphingobacteriaceae bacterium]|nr:MAG: hypothetical protein EOP47_04595 [Sphingobacteriaceae bacterium]